MTATALNTRQVAQEARAFARATGSEVGVRGRLSLDAFTAYLRANPRRAREIASQAGVEVGTRGRLSAEKAAAIATLVR